MLLRPLPYGEPDRLVVVWDRVSRVGQDRNIGSPAIAPAKPEMYVPYLDWPRPNASLVVRAAGVAAGPLVSWIRAALARVDAGVPLANVKRPARASASVRASPVPALRATRVDPAVCLRA